MLLHGNGRGAVSISLKINFFAVFLFAVYLEISKLQSEITSQSETQQQLIEALNALKNKISTLSEHKQIVTNEGSKLLVSMQSFYEWASL